MYFRNIENLRVDADLTQMQVARLLGCHRDIYRRYEKGITAIPVWALIKLADYYNVTTDYLLGRTREKSPHCQHGR